MRWSHADQSCYSLRMELQWFSIMQLTHIRLKLSTIECWLALIPWGHCYLSMLDHPVNSARLWNGTLQNLQFIHHESFKPLMISGWSWRAPRGALMLFGHREMCYADAMILPKGKTQREEERWSVNGACDMVKVWMETDHCQPEKKWNECVAANLICLG